MYNESPSKLAHEALGIYAEPGPVEGSFECALCQHEFMNGGYHYKPSPKFNNFSDTSPSDKFCKHCKVVTTGSQFILQNKCAVYTEKGVYSLNKDIDLAAFIFHPPEPPFVAVFGMIKQQHLVWRTPVSNSIELFSFRLGDYLYVVERQKVLDLRYSYLATLREINAFRVLTSPKKVKPLPSLFSVPTSAIRGMSDSRALIFSPAIESIRRDAKQIVADNGDFEHEACALLESIHACTEQFQSCNYAEVFLALACTKNSESDIQAYAEKRNLKG